MYWYKSISLSYILYQHFIPINTKPILCNKSSFSFCLFPFLPKLGMHNFILIIEILWKSTCRHIFDFPLKHLRDRIAHLLQNIQKEHELILPLFAISHVFIQFLDSCLKFFVLLKDFFVLFWLSIKFTVVYQIQIYTRLIAAFHLLNESTSSSLLVLFYVRF